MLRKIRAHDARYVFLTNGGGSHEDAKFRSLSKRLELSEDEDVIRNRIILSHTPMRGWDEQIKKQGTVLITGSHPETARRVANESVPTHALCDILGRETIMLTRRRAQIRVC